MCHGAIDLHKVPFSSKNPNRFHRIRGDRLRHSFLVDSGLCSKFNEFKHKEWHSVRKTLMGFFLSGKLKEKRMSSEVASVTRSKRVDKGTPPPGCFGSASFVLPRLVPQGGNIYASEELPELNVSQI